MNSEVTLTNYSTSESSKGQVRLLYKRSDQQNAILLGDDVPQYFLTMSNDGMSEVKIRDAARQMIAEVNKRMILSDIFTFTTRNGGKAVKVADVLRKAPSASDGQVTMTLHTEEGTYHWRKRQAHHWALYEDSSYTPIAWTETVPGTGPTWVLVLESRALSLVDYILASLLYLRIESVRTEARDGWEHVNPRTAALMTG